MAVLQKIRGWGIWLSLIIAFALLLFLLDPSSISQFFGIGAPKQDPVGYVNGEKITYEEFVDASNKYDVYKDYLLDDEMVLNNTAFRSILYDRLFMPKMEEAGLYFTDAQVEEALRTNGLAAIPPQTMQMFLSAAEQGNPGVKQVVDVMRQDAKNELYARNYSRLIAQSNYANAAYLDRLVADYNNKTTVDVIVLNPSKEGVSVSDDEIRSEYNLHKYPTQPRSREIAYLDFHAYPSEEDMAAATEKYNGLYEKFTTEPADRIARFLKANSAEKEVKFYQAGELDEELDALVFGAGANQTEILADGYDFTAARVLSSGVRNFSGSVNIYGFEDAAKADSLVACLNAGEPVDSLVARHEIYSFSAPRNIDRNEASVSLGNTALRLDEMLDEPVNSFRVFTSGTEKYACAMASKDEPVLLKEVAILAMHVKPSEQTIAAVENNATEFVVAATDLEKFNELRPTADARYYEATVYDGMSQYQTVEGSVDNLGRISHDLFEVKPGSVIYRSAGSYDFFAIALKSARDEGPATLDEVKEDLSEYLVSRKAAQNRLAEVRGDVAAATQLADLAEKWGEGVREMTIGYSSANDPRLFGAVSAYEVGEIGTVAGTDGKVYVFQVKDRNEDIHTDRDALRTRYIQQSARLVADSPAYMGREFNLLSMPDALRYVLRGSKVKDHLLRFFYQ